MSAWMHCFDCQLFGTPIPENDNTCGNCGSHNAEMLVPASELAQLKDSHAKLVRDLAYQEETVLPQLRAELDKKDTFLKTDMAVMEMQKAELDEAKRLLDDARDFLSGVDYWADSDWEKFAHLWLLNYSRLSWLAKQDGDA